MNAIMFSEAPTRSLPSRERGLKLEIALIIELLFKQSLPSRERGLKFKSHPHAPLTRVVAPFTGAWIEIAPLGGELMGDPVAPFTGAWIEITPSG